MGWLMRVGWVWCMFRFLIFCVCCCVCVWLLLFWSWRFMRCVWLNCVRRLVVLFGMVSWRWWKLLVFELCWVCGSVCSFWVVDLWLVLFGVGWC